MDTARPARPRRYASEAALVRELVLRLRSWVPGAHAHKVHGGPHGQAGEPDVDACVPVPELGGAGRAVKVEAKMPGRRPTPVQYGAMRRWEAAGALVGWVTSVEQLEELLAHLPEPGWRNPQLERAAAP